MSEFKFESFEDFEGFLTTLPVEKLKSSFPVLVALFEKQRKTFELWLFYCESWLCM